MGKKGNKKSKGKGSKGRGDRLITGPVESLQVKPIFSVAPKVTVGSKVKFMVRLEKCVTTEEQYGISKLLLSDGEVGDAKVSSTPIKVSSGDSLEFEVEFTKQGWVFLVVTELTTFKSIPGAVYVTA